MNFFDRWATRYGNFVAESKVPTFPYIRRLAKASPRDYSIFVFWNVVVSGGINGFRISRLKNENKKLRKENERLERLFSIQQRVFPPKETTP